MKTKLVALLLGAALAGGSTAGLAGPGKSDRHDRPRAERAQQHQWGDRHSRKDRVYASSRHHARDYRHGPRWGKGNGHGRHHAKSRHHGHRWSSQRHYRHYDGHRRPHGSHYHRHVPPNRLSIILHGHF